MNSLLVFLLFLATTSGYTFTKCSFAQALIRDGVPRKEVPHWVCMAEADSGLRTDAHSTNHDGSADHGIFQINDFWYCDPKNGHKTRNGCHHNCLDFEDKNFADDVACIRSNIDRHHGDFSSFSYGYKVNCEGVVSATYLAGCSY